TFGTTVHLINSETGDVVDSLKAPSAVNAAFWGGPDGRRLAAYNVNGAKIYVWDMTRRSDRPMELDHSNAGVAAFFHSSGDLLMSTSWDDVTRIWDTATGNELLHSTDVAPLEQSVRSFGDRIPARFGGSTIGFWELSRFRECRLTPRSFIKPNGNPLSIAFNA